MTILESVRLKLQRALLNAHRVSVLGLDERELKIKTLQALKHCALNTGFELCHARTPSR
jgi:hypothetical protein